MKKNSIHLILTILIIATGCQHKAVPPEESTNDFSFVFMTDIHLQPENNAPEGFAQAIEKAKELHPDFVIMGGDMIMDALGTSYERADSQYVIYQNAVKKFDIPVYNTVGNHELYGIYESSNADTTDEMFNTGMYEKYLGKRYYSFDHKGWHFIILDAVQATNERRYIGFIDEEQQAWLQSHLQSVDTTTPIGISVHIPFITSLSQVKKGSLTPNTQGLVISNSKEVLELFENHNLRLVLQGHLHYLEDINVRNKTHFITGGAVSGGWWGGPHNGVEEGFLLFNVKNDDFTWEYIDYGWEVETN